MKKIFIMICVLSSFAFATPAELFAKLGYQPTYEKALESAKKMNKPVMIVIGERTCPWCRKLEQQVLKKDFINAKVQADYVAVGLEKKVDTYPKQFEPKVVPTVVFVNPKDESVIFNSYGYIPKMSF